MGNGVSNKLTRNALTLAEVERRHARIQAYLTFINSTDPDSAGDRQAYAADRQAYDRLFREPSAMVETTTVGAFGGTYGEVAFRNKSLEWILTFSFDTRVSNVLVIMDPDVYRAFCRAYDLAMKYEGDRFSTQRVATTTRPPPPCVGDASSASLQK